MRCACVRVCVRECAYTCGNAIHLLHAVEWHAGKKYAIPFLHARSRPTTRALELKLGQIAQYARNRTSLVNGRAFHTCKSYVHTHNTHTQDQHQSAVSLRTQSVPGCKCVCVCCVCIDDERVIYDLRSPLNANVIRQISGKSQYE